MKKVMPLVVLLFSFLCVSVSANAASGPTKHVVIAGSGGLEVAAKECAPFLGQPSWQACVAHHDGLYTPNADGSISRGYIRNEFVSKPNADGPVKCVAEFVKMPNGDIGWVFPADLICKTAK